MRPADRPLLLALNLAAAAACSSAGRPAKVVRPQEITATEALGSGGAKANACRAVSPRAEPLIVDWKMQERVDLEVAMQQGVAVVAHDCQQLRLLKGCSAKGGYRFAGVSRKEQVIQVQDQDDLAATVPLGPARLGAELKRGSTIDIGIVLVGKRATPARELGRPELVGDCEGATHFVRAATVGAFAVGTGTAGRLGAIADLFGVGVNAGSASERKSLSRDGELEACKAARPGDEAPPDQCQSAVQLELAPVVAEVKAAEAPMKGEVSAACPEGTVRAGGVCTAHATGPFECRGEEPSVCKEQCDRGNLESCFRYAMHLNLELWAPNGSPPAGAERTMNELLARACEGGVAGACYELGAAAESSEGPASPDSDRQVALLERACALGHGDACFTLGRVFHKAAIVTPDPARAVALARRGCMAGSLLACSDWSAVYEQGLGVAKDPAKAREVAEIACDAKDALSCERVARLEIQAKRYASGVRFMARRCELSPERCRLPADRRAAADDAAGKALLEDLCKAKVPDVCAWLGRKAK